MLTTMMRMDWTDGTSITQPENAFEKLKQLPSATPAEPHSVALGLSI